jgi:putative glutamine transport system substrate-binding protein
MNNRKLYPVLICMALAIVAILLTGLSSIVSAQGERTPVPLATLIPPTVVPPPPTATPIPPSPLSVLARFKDPKAPLRVGILYNVGRFSTLTDTGDVRGFEADLAEAIAEDWGVGVATAADAGKVQYVQVTHQNALSMLLSGKIDLLMGQVMISRDQQAQIDFSDPIFVNKQVALTNADAPFKDIKDLAGQTVGVMYGSPSEQAFTDWMQANGLQATVKRYVTMDDTLKGLINKEISAVIGDRWELDRKVNGIIQGVKLLDGVFRTEPYGIAMRRFDDNLRTLVNRTLQRLVDSKRLDPLYDVWFPKNLMPAEERVIPRVWKDLSTDSRAVADFPTDIVMPAQPVVPKIKAGQAIRVAGIGAPPDDTGKPSLLDAFNQAMITEMARRWGVQVQLVPDSYGKAEDVLASGAADLAIGIEPHWSSVDRVDFCGIYARHTYRIMIPYGSTAIQSFNDLFSSRRQIGYFADDPYAIELAKKLSEGLRMAPDTIRPVPLTSIDDAIERLTTDHTANIVFGDSLRLIPIVQAKPTFVQLTNGEYGDARPIAFAVPRNDADFRVLVEVTLQDMYRDGSYQRIFKDTFAIGDPLSMIVWPGPSTVFGIKTGG